MEIREVTVMAWLRKSRARKPLVEDSKLFMSASSEGLHGFTVGLTSDEGVDYFVEFTLADATRFAAFVHEMAQRRNVAAYQDASKV